MWLGVYGPQQSISSLSIFIIYFELTLAQGLANCSLWARPGPLPISLGPLN